MCCEASYNIEELFLEHYQQNGHPYGSEKIMSKGNNGMAENMKAHSQHYLKFL